MTYTYSYMPEVVIGALADRKSVVSPIIGALAPMRPHRCASTYDLIGASAPMSVIGASAPMTFIGALADRKSAPMMCS